MVAQQQPNKPKGSLSPKKESASKSPSKDKDKEKEKKGPPFAHKEGKLGDTKQWNGRTYYYCPANHKHSHWHTHKVEECNTYKKMIKKKTTTSSLLLLTTTMSPWTLIRRSKVWLPSSLPETLTQMILPMPSLPSSRVPLDSCSCGFGVHICSSAYHFTSTTGYMDYGGCFLPI